MMCVIFKNIFFKDHIAMKELHVLLFVYLLYSEAMKIVWIEYALVYQWLTKNGNLLLQRDISRRHILSYDLHNTLVDFIDTQMMHWYIIRLLGKV